VQRQLLKGYLESTERYDSIYRYNSLMTVSKIVYTLPGDPLYFDALDFSLPIYFNTRVGQQHKNI
jgi:hypothetical protein